MHGIMDATICALQLWTKFCPYSENIGYNFFSMFVYSEIEFLIQNSTSISDIRNSNFCHLKCQF
jgi:hypothetical protein